MTAVHGHRDASPTLDVSEHGAPRDGVPQTMNRRLYMQLLVFEAAPGSSPSGLVRGVGESLAARGAAAVLYEDVNHPSGIGLLSWTENPEDFVTRIRPAIEDSRAAGLRVRPEFTMFGRS